MGLDITSSDNEKTFRIGYSSFTLMRSLFVLHYSKELYYKYFEIICRLGFCSDEEWENVCNNVNNLDILLKHSDCDGELSSDECKLLINSLFVDEEKIRALSTEKNEYYERMIKSMYEFITLIRYCAENDDVELIFG